MTEQALAMLFFYLIGAVACGWVLIPISWSRSRKRAKTKSS